MEQMKTSWEISKCAGGWADAAARPGDETTKRHADLMAALYEIAYQLAVGNELKAAPDSPKFVLAVAASEAPVPPWADSICRS